MADGADQDYDAEPVVCHACAARDRASTAWLKQDGAETAGLMWRTYRKEG